MSQKLIYLDNAATSYPKPEQVYAAVDRSMREGGSAGRGAHKLAMDAARQVFDARNSIAQFLGCHGERLVFTPGCTHSINYVLKGIPLELGDTVVVSALEHNSIMRPLHQLVRTKKINVAVLPYSAGEIVGKASLRDALKSLKPKLCALTHGSNVTGEMLNLEVVAEICRDQNVPLLIDAAQTAGREQGVLSHKGITFWAASGHKGLFGPSGIGVLYVNPRFDLEPLIAGGTGSASEKLEVPAEYPDHLEPGTVATHNIAGLAAGVEFVKETGPKTIQEHEERLMKRFLEWCRSNPQINTFGQISSNKRLPLHSFDCRALTPDRVADMLDTEYGIAVRAGLHCAAQAHKTLGTTKRGTVRASFGFFNTDGDVEALCTALATLTRHATLA